MWWVSCYIDGQYKLKFDVKPYKDDPEANFQFNRRCYRLILNRWYSQENDGLAWCGTSPLQQWLPSDGSVNIAVMHFKSLIDSDDD